MEHAVVLSSAWASCDISASFSPFLSFSIDPVGAYRAESTSDTVASVHCVPQSLSCEFDLTLVTFGAAQRFLAFTATSISVSFVTDSAF